MRTEVLIYVRASVRGVCAEFAFSGSIAHTPRTLLRPCARFKQLRYLGFKLYRAQRTVNPL